MVQGIPQYAHLLACLSRICRFTVMVNMEASEPFIAPPFRPY
jgi:hypothetical protein